ncbi:hypothetical protein AR158_c724L [Paramecium bursaria Chlorella virus AR158]|uniref:hypothetical protein n=1 Tax=Paramecium bursaria Chlorella virus AR158 TaxID=380598 RepID=UPI00015AA88C|nr:hypothetical protein AR158_c724L [Paramecium bursaria Chlorella virus AR158]ABU44269.1 hypothetical protein AR158_c724L [Paramecium bursaria Chlorella virus AR158]
MKHEHPTFSDERIYEASYINFLIIFDDQMMRFHIGVEPCLPVVKRHDVIYLILYLFYMTSDDMTSDDTTSDDTRSSYRHIGIYNRHDL